MENISCPHCHESCISPKQKWLATKWKDIYCPQCGGRSCANPIFLAIMYFLLTWDIAFFGFMALYESSWAYFAVMVVGWLLIEFFTYYVPLARMRQKQTPPH